MSPKTNFKLCSQFKFRSILIYWDFQVTFYILNNNLVSLKTWLACPKNFLQFCRVRDLTIINKLYTEKSLATALGNCKRAVAQKDTRTCDRGAPRDFSLNQVGRDFFSILIPTASWMHSQEMTVGDERAGKFSREEEGGHEIESEWLLTLFFPTGQPCLKPVIVFSGLPRKKSRPAKLITGCRSRKRSHYSVSRKTFIPSRQTKSWQIGIDLFETYILIMWSFTQYIASGRFIGKFLNNAANWVYILRLGNNARRELGAVYIR